MSAAKGMLIPESGKNFKTAIPITAPAAPPMVNNGAKVPPDVPLPNAIAHDMNLKIHKLSTSVNGHVPDKMPVMLSYPTPNVCGAKKPITPTARPPIAGHHIQWIGSSSNK